ncbi:MAG: hypothetical protein A2Y10_06045 [Planctomycetes bacterium GWF2_41_51]|nr:MAG: hypothetical protein A2Y10_06045 [Planctomycetes bacterium GWF2_41_51]
MAEQQITIAELNNFRRPALKIRGIGGWLTIPAIGLVCAPIISTLQFFVGISNIQTFMPELTSDLRLWFSGVIDIVMIIAAIIIAVLFFKHRRSAISAFIGLIIASIFANLIQALINASIFKEVTIDSINPVIAVCVYATIWIPYFMKSKRVKNTFTE